MNSLVKSLKNQFLSLFFRLGCFFLLIPNLLFFCCLLYFYFFLLFWSLLLFSTSSVLAFFSLSFFSLLFFYFYYPNFLYFSLYCLPYFSEYFVIFTSPILQLISGLWLVSHSISKIILVKVMNDKLDFILFLFFFILSIFYLFLF